MIDAKQFLKLKQKNEDLKSQIDQAKGAYEQLKKQVQSEFDVNSVEGIEKLLAKKEKIQIQKEQLYTAEIEQLKQEHPLLFG